jgi:hypothetical protein
VAILNKQLTEEKTAKRASSAAATAAAFAAYRPLGDSPPTASAGAAMLPSGSSLSRSWHSSGTALTFMPSSGSTLQHALQSAAMAAGTNRSTDASGVTVGSVAGTAHVAPAAVADGVSTHVGSSSIKLQAGPSFSSEHSSYFGNPLPARPQAPLKMVSAS